MRDGRLGLKPSVFIHFNLLHTKAKNNKSKAFKLAGAGAAVIQGAALEHRWETEEVTLRLQPSVIIRFNLLKTSMP